MRAKKMSIYSLENSRWIAIDRWSGYSKTEYIPLTESNVNKFLKQVEKVKAKWHKIVDKGFISTHDISRLTLWSVENVKRWMEKDGCESFIDRKIYESGAKFWRLEDAERVFPELEQELNKQLDALKETKEYFEGELLSIWYGYFGKKLYVEEVRKKYEAHKKEELKRKREKMLKDEESVLVLMDEIFETRKNSGGASINDILDDRLDGREVIYVN